MSWRRKITSTIVFGVGLLYPCLAQASFAAHKSYTVQAAQITGTLTDFTVDVAFTDADLKAVGSGGYVQNASGFDIGFYSNSDCSTGKLHWATIFWTGTSGAFHYKVKIASAAVSSVIYQCFGDAGITTDQSDPTNSVDGNTCASWSYGNGSTLSLTDITGGNNGTNHSTTATTGQVSGGVALSGSSQYVDAGTGSACITTGIAATNLTFTIYAWVKPTDTGNFYWVLAKTHSNIASSFEYRLENSTGVPTLFVGNGSTQSSAMAASAAPGTGSFHFIAVTYDYNGGTPAYVHYLGSSTNGSGTGGGVPGDMGDNMLIGTRSDLFAYYKGSIDEEGIDKVVRTAAWLGAKFNNQNSMSGFWTVSACTGCTPSSKPVGEMMTMGAGK